MDRQPRFVTTEGGRGFVPLSGFNKLLRFLPLFDPFSTRRRRASAGDLRACHSSLSEQAQKKTSP